MQFANHYDERFEGTTAGIRTPPIPLAEVEQPVPTSLPGFYYHHPKLRVGNGPRIFYHGDQSRDVIVLTHGFTDSPFYVQDIAGCFFREGCNVVMPLLPAHGLIKPDVAIRDEMLDIKWRDTIDSSVAIARLLGERVSIGGFSTGAALSLNKILRHSEMIEGGLFLFSAALSLGKVLDTVGNSGVVEWAVGFFLDRTAVPGAGPDPYKYPVLPSAVASEIIEVIQENNEKLRTFGQLPQPVFAAHSHKDTTASIQGVIDFLAQYVPADNQRFFEVEEIKHAALTLKNTVPIDIGLIGQNMKDPQRIKAKQDEWLTHVSANPFFDEMMSQAIHFFKTRVQGQQEPS